MHILRAIPRIKDVFSDFLFPKSKRVLELEKLSPSKLLETLPQAEKLKSEHVIALFDYSNILVKEIVWEIKYNGNTKLAEIVGTLIYDTISDTLGELAPLSSGDGLLRPAVVPIPISDKRRFERGWNQSEILAEKILKCDSAKRFKYLPRQLSKAFHTESQTKTSSRSERMKNLTNSMRVLNKDSVAGRTVFVIDDVTTTGSTFSEARRALTVAGAKKIICIAIAH